MKAYWKAFGLLHVVVAVPWMGPMETLIGLWPLDGISPRPTQAPGLNGLPRELVKRKGGLTLPANYCGFVSADDRECCPLSVINAQPLIAVSRVSSDVPDFPNMCQRRFRSWLLRRSGFLHQSLHILRESCRYFVGL